MSKLLTFNKRRLQLLLLHFFFFFSHAKNDLIKFKLQLIIEAVKNILESAMTN